MGHLLRENIDVKQIVLVHGDGISRIHYDSLTNWHITVKCFTWFTSLTDNLALGGSKFKGFYDY